MVTKDSLMAVDVQKLKNMRPRSVEEAIPHRVAGQDTHLLR